MFTASFFIFTTLVIILKSAYPQEATLPVKKRMAFLLKRLETLVVEHVLRALFKADRLTFLLHLTYRLRPHEVRDTVSHSLRG